MGQIQSFGDLVSMLRRRAFLICIVALVGIALAIEYATSQPRLFEATAVIQIETPLIVDDTAAGGQTGSSAAQRIQLIEQRLMVRENILAMIAKHKLFADLPGLTDAQKVLALRQATRIDAVSSVPAANGGGGQLSALVVTVQLGTAQQTADVANDFAASVLSQSSANRSDQARQTLDFYDSEQARLGTELAALEAEVADYKRTNTLALPESLDARREEVTRIENSAAALDDQIAELTRQRSALGFEGAAGSGATVADQIRILELELAQARQKFIARAPEVLSLEARIAALKGGSTDGLTGETQRQIADLTSQIAGVQTQKAALLARKTALDDSIRQTPAIQIALVAYDRRLQQLQDRFDAASRQRSEAEIAQRLEDSKQSERFELLEPAILPDYPVAPSRKKLVVMGAGASVGVGLGLALLLEVLNPVIRTAAQLHRALGLHPVISIPYVASPRERRRTRLIRIGKIIVLILGIAVIYMLLIAMRGADR